MSFHSNKDTPSSMMDGVGKHLGELLARMIELQGSEQWGKRDFHTQSIDKTFVHYLMGSGYHQIILKRSASTID